MPNPSRDSVKINIEAASATEARVLPEDEPFRIAVLGDFSGRGERGSLSERKPLLIDRDNFNAILQKLDAGVELPSGRLPVRDMDDFHPDRIYTSYPIFQPYRGAREGLSDPSTFRQAAENITGERPAPVRAVSARNLLNEIIGESATAAAPARKADKLQEFVENAVRPHVVERQDPRAPGMIRKVDEAASDLMRAVLHHPKFRALESAWRSLSLLVHGLETGPGLKVYVLDVTKDEIAAHPEIVYQSLVRRAEAWALIAADFSFGVNDTSLLRIAGAIARKLLAPFLGHADASVLGGSDEWNAFRRTAEAAHIGLALPRILLRLPYGKATSECETFEFEELTGKPDGKRMAFGNPALFCGMLIGKAFENDGWDMRPGTVRDISRLPVYVYEEEGENVALPCAEVALPQETAEALIENGFMPMASIRNTDVVRALAFQSVADPPAPLPGRWQ